MCTTLACWNVRTASPLVCPAPWWRATIVSSPTVVSQTSVNVTSGKGSALPVCSLVCRCQSALFRWATIEPTTGRKVALPPVWSP